MAILHVKQLHRFVRREEVQVLFDHGTTNSLEYPTQESLLGPITMYLLAWCEDQVLQGEDLLGKSMPMLSCR